MKESMLLCPRVETGFGNPPNDFTSYDSKWSNFAINYGLRFSFWGKTNEIKKIINTQFNNSDHALFRTGPYDVADEFKQAIVSDDWLKPKD